MEASEAEFRVWLAKELRRCHHKYKPRKAAYVSARESRGKYKCAYCAGLFGPKEIAVDHIKPVVDPKTGFVNWDDHIKRLFCAEENYQVLCKKCHTEKSNYENAKRREMRAEGKY